jgi:hypothetical protein
MTQKVTVEQIRDKIRLAGDSQNATLRTTDADIDSLIADAYGRYIGQASGAGWTYWLTYSEGTLSVGRSSSNESDFPFGLLTWQGDTSGIEGIYRFEIRLGNGEWRELEPIAFQQVNGYQSSWGAATANGIPLAYWAHGGNAANENGNTQDIGFAPPSDQAYNYRIWYANITTAPNDLTELEVGMVGADWWIVWDVVETLAIRDHYPDMAQMAAAKKQGCWVELVQRRSARNKDKTFRIRDTKSRRRQMSAYRWPWGG